MDITTHTKDIAFMFLLHIIKNFFGGKTFVKIKY